MSISQGNGTATIMEAIPARRVRRAGTAEWRWIGPQEATEMLERSATLRNRKVRDVQVRGLALDMLEKRWKRTGEPIILTIDGQVLDGQHRLFAVIESGMTIEFLVLVGIDKDAMSAIDKGLPRTLSDELHRKEVALPGACASLTNTLWRWDHRGTMVPSPASPGDTPTKEQALDFFDEHRAEIEAAIAQAHIGGMRKLAYSGVMSTLAAIFARINTDDCSDFFVKLAGGENLGAKDAIFLFRSRLLDARVSPGKPSGHRIGALGIKAWNAYRDGRPLGTLKWTPGGANPEPFPKPN